MIDMVCIGKRIKELRSDKNMNQAEFSKLISTNQSTLSAYERGERVPPYETLICVAQLCNVSLDWLCGLSNKRTAAHKICSCSDLIQIIVQLKEINGVELTLQTESRSSDAKLKCVFEIPELTDFYTEWQEMKVVRDTEPMGAKLYQLWLKDVLEKGENRWIP